MKNGKKYAMMVVRNDVHVGSFLFLRVWLVLIVVLSSHLEQSGVLQE